MEKMRGGNIRGLSLVMKRISVVVATYKDKLINLNKINITNIKNSKN